MWELVEDDDIVEDVQVLDDEPPAKAAPRVKAAPVGGTKESATTQNRKPLRAKAEENEDDDRPKEQKKKKKRRSAAISPVDEDQEARDRALREFEYIWPGILLVAGFVMCAVGAFGVSDGVSAAVTIVVMAVGLLITIPTSIIALMVIGIVLGIEYGRLLPAILKIAAIALVTNGVYFLGDWAHLPFFVIFPIGCGVSFGLFMAQFDLDTWETNASVGALNVMTFIANIVMIGFLVVASVAATRGGSDDDYDSDEDVPANVQKDGGNGQPRIVDPDDLDDE